ncbi:beta-fructofuranosidase [Xaviernesmea oryzae]|uniref:beta-fructofuranosidase n=1 Tax=Xaviernesmea oryzae TaxID=464029 RepID=A0A1Q9B1Z5_9HYPH|nr:beta-fructofuranosidase [Xaviernesmea oryzae]OLP62021.1 beta-fructofuranosidase [Xaviernesmea oryzae]SEK96709.1 beta-fructofuranosidase [Xaviernesmea oryzae]
MTEQTSSLSAALTTRLAPGSHIHLWLKARQSGSPARLTLTLDGHSAGEANTDNAAEFAFRLLEAHKGGSAVLAYDPATTELSAAYAFHPDQVMEEGIALLSHGPANAPPADLPLYHFTPPFGWMNDPNGFGRFGGSAHLFYQHYPHSLRWNNMHWGHAVSQDVLRWRHLPIFLFPNDELSKTAEGLGGAFSGSAIAEGDGSIRVFFTEQVKDREPEEQNQWSAVSTDGVTAGPAELVLPARPEGLNLTLDFRDPYVIKGPDGRFKMLLGSRDRDGGVVLLYETDDPQAATGWRYLGILHRENRFGMTAAECPCLVPLGPPEDAETRWALIFALLTSRCPQTGRRNLTIATVGRFDGQSFSPEFEQELDFATDAYAFQGFRDGDDTIAIAWLANWTDVSKKIDFHSAMTLPRRLVLEGDALLSPPIDAVETLRSAALDAGALQRPEGLALGDGAVEILLTATQAGAAFRLEIDHPDLTLGVEQTGDGLAILYGVPGDKPAPRYLARDAAAKEIRIFLDRGSIEVFADGGRWSGTKRLKSFAPAKAARLTSGGDLLEAKAFALAL